jgi:ParB/RepB/Spo0J family partition protein
MPRIMIQVPLKSLVVMQAQVRTRDVANQVDELAASLARQGLIEPIVISETDQSGTYQILAGQRRVLAAKKLGWDVIDAVIQDLSGVDDVEAKVKEISLTENVQRVDLKRQDLIDACEHLFNKYGSIKAVVEETGLQRSVVTQYVRVARLYSELKPLVINQDYDVETVLMAQDMATSNETGGVNIEQAKRIALELKGLDNAARRNAKDLLKNNPDTPIGDLIKTATSAPRVQKVTVSFDQRSSRALKSYGEENDENGKAPSLGLLVQQIVLDQLTEQGFLNE